MAENVMFQETIDAIRQGQRRRARDLLTRLLKTDQSNPEYWLWMSAVVDSPKERIYCLQTVLRLDPENHAARQGLVLLGALPPPQDLTPAPPVRRKWEVALQEAPRPRGLKGILTNPVLRAVTLVILTMIVLGLIAGGIFGFGFGRRFTIAFRPSKTPGPPPTFTATPTFIGKPGLATAQPTPTFLGPKPLWARLEATYTPTPLYVGTPHAISEAFRMGQRAYLRGDWQAALDSMQQASEVEPNAADIQYYIGEIQRFLGDYESALAAYEQAMQINSNFGPAYLGHARARLALDPQSDVSEDLQKAIQKDPNFGEAYLEEASFLIKRGEVEPALKDLQAAGRLLPDSPLLYLLRAQADLLQGKDEEALEEARHARDMDITYLPSYLTLGQAALKNGEYAQAILALQTYLTYVLDDPIGWTALGQAYYQIKQYESALDAIDKAIDLDEQLIDAYVYRGLVYLGLDEGQQAVNDMVAARRLDARSFEANLGLGRALMATGRLKEARDVLNNCQDLAQTDAELAAVYYWRAQILEALGNFPSASQDWQALLNLPQEAFPIDWAVTARQKLSPTVTPPTAITATPSSTSTTRTPRSATLTPTSITRTPTAATPQVASSTPTPTKSR